VRRFEDLRVWQEAKRLCDFLHPLLRGREFGREPVLRDQLDSAAISTANNIAEGFARHHRRDFARFVRIALASNQEARCALLLAQARRCLSLADSGHALEMTTNIDRMLRALGRSLTGSEFANHR
jgi:four helix bundle protein